MKNNVLLKRLQVFMMSITFLLGISTIGYGQYCVPIITDDCSLGDEIADFSLDHDNGTVTFDDGCSAGVFVDLTATTFYFTAGESYDGFIETNDFEDIAMVWIDFNQDEDFTIDEFFFLGYPADDPNFTLEIPNSAPPGETKMRVFVNWDLPYAYEVMLFEDGPCEIWYGQMLEYTVNITNTGTLCDGTPTAGTLSSSPSSGGSGTIITLENVGHSEGVGITYTWHYQFDNNGWLTIPGATPDFQQLTIQGPVGSVLEIYLEVKCLESGISSNSNSAFFTIEGLCVPVIAGGCEDENFALLEIEDDGAGIYYDQGCLDQDGNGYSDFSGTTTAYMTAGESYDVTVETSTPYGAYAFVWIDFNQDGDFSNDEGFLLNNTSIAAGQTLEASISMPYSALPGETRMRVIIQYWNDIGLGDPCVWDWGQALDYTVDITNTAEICAGEPDHGTLSISPSSGGTGTTITLENVGHSEGIGISYTWHYQFNNDGWLTIPNATPDFQQLIVTGNDGSVLQVYLEVYCSLSDESSTSNTVTFTIEGICAAYMNGGCEDEYFALLDIEDDGAGIYFDEGCLDEDGLGYTDYTGTTTAYMTAGETYDITIETGSPYGVFALVWIDFNHDDVFSLEERFVLNSTAVLVSGQTLESSITIPYSALPGETRMRVALQYWDDDGLGDPCVWTWGQALDYTVDITNDADICDGEPNGGTLTINPTSTQLLSESVTFTTVGHDVAIGLEYAWHYKFNDEGWQSLATGTPESQTLTINGEPGDIVSIRLATTCTLTDDTGYSNIEIFEFLGPDDYCVPNFDDDYFGDFITNFSLSNVNNASGSYSTSPGYSDFTNLDMIDLEVGESYTANVSIDEPDDFFGAAAIFIDLNDDNYFSQSEKVAIIDDFSGSNPFDFSSFALGAEHIGIHRLRVIYYWGVSASEIPGCPDDWYGEAEDYMVNVYSDIACDDYPMVTDDEIGKTTASFTWDEIPGSAEIQIRYKKQGAAVNWTYVYLPGDATGVELTGLHHETDYYIQSSSRCEGSSTFGARMPINLTPSSTQGKFSTLPLDLCDYPPVVVSAGEVTTTSIDVQWTIVDDISVFNLRYKVAGASTPWTYVELDPTSTSYLLTGLSVNTDYYVQVRTMCETDDDYSVLWSTVVMLSTEDFGDCSAAPSLNVEETTSNAVLLTWTPIAGAEMYDIRYKKAGVGGWMHKFVPGDQSSTWLTGLASGVTYYIQASTKCIGSDIYGDRNPPISATPTAQGGGSGLAKYEDDMTSDEVKVNDEISVTDEMEVVMYPNPTSGVLNIDVVLNDMVESGDVEVHVYDMSGRIVNTTSSQMNSGFNNVRLNLGELTTGLYNVVLYKDGVAIHRGKVQKQ